MSPKLQGAGVAITGAAGDLGHAMSLELARLGARVTMIDRVSAADAAQRIAAVKQAGQCTYVQADVTNHPALFARNPGWHAFFDQDPQMAEATRRKVYDMLVADKMMVQGFHYPFPSVAYVEKAGSGYREIPVAWNPVL